MTQIMIWYESRLPPTYLFVNLNNYQLEVSLRASKNAVIFYKDHTKGQLEVVLTYINNTITTNSIFAKKIFYFLIAMLSFRQIGILMK